MEYTELKKGKYYKCDKVNWLKNYKKLTKITEDYYGGTALQFTYNYILVIVYKNDYNFIEKVDRWKNKIKE